MVFLSITFLQFFATGSNEASRVPKRFRPPNDVDSTSFEGLARQFRYLPSAAWIAK